MKFICQTRGGASPQGKPRVYFTGHPEDLPACSEEIFADLLKIQNCAIYYDAEPEAPCSAEELLGELEQMQLIVIPVTARFLDQPNRAREIELPFAMEHHIPVLPLMQEPGLESAFNKKCGDLQMLNKNDPDPTALPYAEKLEKFLSSVLVGDELAEKVRAAFDAYVFLSYRKKDRKYAQELMRLIHKNEFCRDIAIWYDEFLTPGENFNQAIADAMKKCDLFTLTVTPSLLEPDNYVMSTEYPEARKADKIILPIELVSTDRKALENAFPDIGNCTLAWDKEALTATLLAAVKRLAIRENDSSPEHNFFIGLAYLNGIDVEVDRGRALSLITGAAEAGLPEAIDKLVNMYRTGSGVERSYRTAVHWQERLVALMEQRFAQSRSEPDALALMDALYFLSECCDDLWEKGAAQRACRRAKEIGEAVAAETGSRKIREALADACQSLGYLYDMERQFNDAWQCYAQAVELNWQLWDEEPCRLYLRNISGNYGSLGGVRYAQGKLEEAMEYHKRGLEIARLLVKEYAGTSERTRLAHSCELLGNDLRAQGRLNEAKDCYLESLDIHEQLYQELQSLQMLRNVGKCHNYLGNLCRSQRELQNALDHFGEFVRIGRYCYQELGDAQTKRDLAVGLGKMGNIFLDAGQPGNAEPYLSESVSLAWQMAEENGTVEAKRLLGVGLEHLGRAAADQGQMERARKFYLQGVQVAEPLCRELGTPDTKRNLSILYECLGTIARQERNWAEAKQFYRACLELRQQMLAQTGSLDARRAVLEISYTLAVLLEQMDEVEEAGDCHWNMVTLRAEFYAENPNPQTALYFDEACGRFVQTYRSRNRLPEAAVCCQKCLELCQTLFEQTGQPEIRHSVLLHYIDLGTLRLRLNQVEDAWRIFQYAVTLARKIADEEQSEESYDYLALACTRLGSLCGESGRGLLLEACQIWEQLSRLVPDNETYIQSRANALQLLERLDG